MTPVEAKQLKVGDVVWETIRNDDYYQWRVEILKVVESQVVDIRIYPGCNLFPEELVIVCKSQDNPEERTHAFCDEKVHLTNDEVIRKPFNGEEKGIYRTYDKSIHHCHMTNIKSKALAFDEIGKELAKHTEAIDKLSKEMDVLNKI